jgi:hypothetical protein
MNASAGVKYLSVKQGFNFMNIFTRKIQLRTLLPIPIKFTSVVSLLKKSKSK